MDYAHIHDNIIANARAGFRTKGSTGPSYENHHIIPKCVGGTNDKDNLVLLTTREHFVIHKLLVKIFPTSIPLNNALWIFLTGTRDGLIRTTNSRQYERCKQLMIVELQTRNPMHNEVHKQKKMLSTRLSIDNGTFVPFLSSSEGRQFASNRMNSSNHPMKNPLSVQKKIQTDKDRGHQSWMTTPRGKKYFSEKWKSDLHPLKLQPWKGRTSFRVAVELVDGTQICFQTLKYFYEMFNINKDVAAKIIKTNRIPNKHRLIFARIEKL